MSISVVVLVAALICCLTAAARPDKMPLWISVLLLCLAGLLEALTSLR